MKSKKKIKEMEIALKRAYALLVEFSELSSWQESDNDVLRLIEKAVKQ